MVPALGMKMAHHFRHKSGAEPNCSRETYLHQAAKLAVIKGFGDAKAEGRPYPLTRKQKVVCRDREAITGIVCKETRIEPFDLTAWFDQAEIEAGALGFVADVFLSSPNSNHTMLIEIFVTHACEPAKIASKQRIVEIKIENEEHVQELLEGIDASSQRVSEFNLRPPPDQSKSGCSHCATTVLVFIVFKSGKSLLTHELLPDAIKLAQRGSVIHREFTKGRPIGIMNALEEIEVRVKNAFFEKGVPIRSCLLCKFGAYNRGFEDGPIYCYEKKMALGHNSAGGCREYSVVKSAAELDAQRARQAKWAEGRWGGSGNMMVGLDWDDADVLE